MTSAKFYQNLFLNLMSQSSGSATRGKATIRALTTREFELGTNNLLKGSSVIPSFGDRWNKFFTLIPSKTHKKPEKMNARLYRLKRGKKYWKGFWRSTRPSSWRQSASKTNNSPIRNLVQWWKLKLLLNKNSPKNKRIEPECCLWSRFH